MTDDAPTMTKPELGPRVYVRLTNAETGEAITRTIWRTTKEDVLAQLVAIYGGGVDDTAIEPADDIEFAPNCDEQGSS